MEIRLYQKESSARTPKVAGRRFLGLVREPVGNQFAKTRNAPPPPHFPRVFRDETGSQNWFPLKGKRGGNQFLTLTGERVLMTLSSVFVSVNRRWEPVGNQLGTSWEKGTSFLQNDAENKAPGPLPGDLQQFAVLRPALKFFAEGRIFHRDPRIS